MTQAVSNLSTDADSAEPSYLYDPWLIVIVGLILGLGLIMVASSSIAIAARDGGSEYYFLWRQLGALALGVVCAAVVLRTPLETIQTWSASVLLVGLGLVVAVLVPGIGREVNGSMRWLKLGPLTLQASEPVKLAVIIYIAGFLVRHQKQVRTELRGFIKPIIVVAFVAGLLLLEPDFGAAVVILSTVLGMLFLGGIPFARFSVGGAAAIMLAGWVAQAAPYRMQRLMAFRDPWADPFHKGFQLTQALIAVGRGEWFGVGLGNSVQKLFYLPEVHTDFIYAVIGEELGLTGACLVIGLFFALLLRVLHIGGRAEDRGQLFAAYLAYGIGLLIAIEAFVNIGVNLGILPTKGLTLPMISYGSNSMVILCIAVALVLRVSYEVQSAPSGPRRPAPTVAQT